MAKKIVSAWAQAQEHLAGGVNSPVRAFKAVGGEPVFMASGSGSQMTDHGGRRYTDYCLSWGALLLGHADKQTVAAVCRQAARGTSFGTATEYETRLAMEIKKTFTSMERIRFTSSGTEAVMSAIRLARGFTQREGFLKFEGCYHGHADSLLVKAGSGLATFGTPDSAGVPRDLAELTAVLPYNDTAALEPFFKKNPRLACVIVEPVAANMGVVPGKKEFLEALRYWTKKTGALLIFDEVISGFRVAYGGAQHVYGIAPDLTILGKIIGGGLPVGAFGGRKEIMDHLSPQGAVYQAGTLSGNPLSMVAGYSVLSRLTKDFYTKLNAQTETFVDRMSQLFAKKGIVVALQRVGSMFTPFFGKTKVENYTEAAACDKVFHKKFFHHYLSHGIYSPPSLMEAHFISPKHTVGDLRRTLEVLETL